jgi:hypothetical protein
MRGDYATVEESRPGVWKVCLVVSLPPFDLFCQQCFWMFYGDADTLGFGMK